MLRYALFLAVVAGGVAWTVTAVRQPPSPPPPAHPLAGASVPRIDVAAARTGLAAQKQRLAAKAADPAAPGRQKAAAVVARGELLLENLVDHDAMLAAVAADPAAVRPELLDATQALLAEAQQVRDETAAADPEAETTWDTIVDVLEFILRVLLLLWDVFGSGDAGDAGESGAGGGGNPAGAAADGGVQKVGGAAGTDLASVVNGKLMVSLQGHAHPYRLTPPADLPQYTVRGVTLAAAGVAFPLQLTLATPDGTVRNFLWQSVDAVPVLRHGK
ncbi:MAG TPA: hypothetical protein VD866_11545 [Urbifossiella sp.]|nr:hypothetical protein [Urbifossiella sp.]